MRLIGVIIFLFIIQISFGQTITLPDVNLKNKLIASYPQVMQGNELDTVKAGALTGTLDLRNSAITDANGIQYFTGITTLDLSYNTVTTIPDISRTSGLINFYASNNNLVSLPDMSALTQLRDFQVMNNQLAALPDLSGATGLLYLYCTNNKITSLPSLTNFPGLLHLVIGDNPFVGPIDFSPCVNLQQLHIHRIGTDTIAGLQNMKKLTMLYAWGNKIRNLSGIDSIKTLKLCMVFDNALTNIPYILNKPDLNLLNVCNNFLTFEDILPVLQNSPPASFQYQPQRLLPFQDITVRAENTLSLKYPVSTPNSSNTYVWIKNGMVKDSSSSFIFTFNALSFSDSGNYVLKVYNTLASDLILSSDTFKINVKPCIEISLPSVKVISKECGKGYTIDLSNVNIDGGTAPFVYQLDNGPETKKSFDKIIQNISAGNYKLTVSDTKNCSADKNFVLEKIQGCDPVLTPNGDGVCDNYFIDKPGKIKIYDLQRRLLNTIDGPVVWDGSDKNGNLLDSGYYIIVTEGQSPVYITIIR